MNQEKNIKDFLKILELAEKEVFVFIEGTKRGSILVSQLARYCGLTRPTVYDIIKKLKKKGLCFEMGTSHGKRVRMASADELEELFERKVAEQKLMLEEFNKSKKNLFSSQHAIDRFSPRITFLEGQESFKKAYIDSLYTHSKQIFTALAENQTIETLGNEFLKWYVNERIKKGIRIKALRPPSSSSNDPFYKKNKEQLRSVRYLPNSVKMTSTILLFDSKTIIFGVGGDDVGVLIDSEDITRTFRDWFNAIWSISKK